MSDNVKGLKELLRTLEKLPKELNEEVGLEVEAAGFDMQADLQQRIRKLFRRITGKLLQSNYVRKINDLTVRVGNFQPYAPFLEHGTAAHVIKPKGKKALKFEVGGKTIFAKEVQHPGIRPRPFFFPATLEARKNLTKRLQSLLDKKFDKI